MKGMVGSEGSTAVSASPSPAPSDMLASYTGMSGMTLAGLSGIDIVPPALDVSLASSPVVANYLCQARLRFLQERPQSLLWMSLWCGRCGAIREGWGGPGPKTTSGTSTPKGTTVKQVSPKRDADGKVKHDDTDGDEFERELQWSLEAFTETLPPARKPPTNRRRKPPACTSCGMTFHRPRPMVPNLPPARTVARTRRAAAASTDVKMEIRAAATNVIPEIAAQLPSPVPSQTPTQPSEPSAPITAPPSPPSLSSTPSLSHIPRSDPHLPTYPRPPVVPPPGPNGSSHKVTIPPSGGQPPAKKRKKKSGLAKLLAQNAARDADKGSGSWGLG